MTAHVHSYWDSEPPMVSTIDHPRPSDTLQTPIGGKKIKTDHVPEQSGHESSFVPGLFNQTKFLCEKYTSSAPYKHAVVSALFDPDLLRGAQKEIIKELSFTEKETDIYKVHQTGDLASLSYLDQSQLSLFPNLLKLRDALYSFAFRTFLQQITGCGPLSGSKQDMSINSYRAGCHLLNHDDVIGTRRWDPSWGGALELYAVKSIGNILEPECSPSCILPPSWNQFVFFEVQPGHSFHSVEEVVVGSSNDSKQRLSISGWFHAPQPGEEGYQASDGWDVRQKQSSLGQLSSSTEGDLIEYSSGLNPTSEALTSDDVKLLSSFINPVYLHPSTLNALREKFAEESSIQLVDFLKEEVAQSLGVALREEDQANDLGPSRTTRIPTRQHGLSTSDWEIRGPPHKHRFCVLNSTPSSRPSAAFSVLRELEVTLFASSAFRRWLHTVSSYIPLKYSTQARRFRPGLDYTLAQSCDYESRLDAVLGLTYPSDEDAISKWEDGNWGGWECYMAPHDGEDDPAVYRSGSSKASGPHTEEALDDEGGSEDGGTLLSVQADFNRLLLVLRDEGVLRFVKYISAAAPGSRWDICGEYSIGMLEETDDG